MNTVFCSMSQFYKFLRMKVFICVLFIWVSVSIMAASAQTELVKIPVIKNDIIYQLDAKIYMPQGNGPFPLIVLTHGTPRTAEDRKMTNVDNYFKKQSEYFANMGYAVIFVVRRGFGNSNAPYTENPLYSNGTRNYTKAGLEAGVDLKAAIEFMRHQDYIDSKRIILIGQSTGGHSVIATGSLNIEGVIGVVNFAGGRGSYEPDKVRDEDNLISSMAQYGKTSHVPTIWLYSENDHYFRPELAQAMFRAYKETGGNGKFITLPPFAEDGHRSFVGNRSAWEPYVVDFLSNTSRNKSI